MTWIIGQRHIVDNYREHCSCHLLVYLKDFNCCNLNVSLLKVLYFTFSFCCIPSVKSSEGVFVVLSIKHLHFKRGSEALKYKTTKTESQILQGWIVQVSVAWARADCVLC